MDHANRKAENIVVAIIAVAFVIWGAVFIYKSSFVAIDGKRYFSLFDDAMISMRYAWNLAHGAGLVWNPGEYIEGYSNLLMTLIMSLATRVLDKSAAVLFIHITGIGFVLASAYLSMGIADHIIQEKHLPRRNLARVLCFLCVVGYYPLVYWPIMGMEGGLLTLLLLLCTRSTLNCAAGGHPSGLLLQGLHAGLAFLTRNDSIIFCVLMWVYILWHIVSVRAGKESFLWLLGAMCLAFGLVIGQVAFRYWYYGELLPNTYTLKLAGMPLLARLGNGLAFVEPFLISTAPILISVGLHMITDFRKVRSLFLAMVLAAICYQIYIGGDAWMYWRMIAPVMPFLLICFVYAMIVFAAFVMRTVRSGRNVLPNRRDRQWYLGGVLAVLAVVSGLVWADQGFASEIVLSTQPFSARSNWANVNTAIALDQLLTEDATVAVHWAGSIPYFTGRKAIDCLGKSDRHIAQLPPDLSGKIGWHGMSSVPGHNKYDLNYSIKTLKPTYVQKLRWGTQNLRDWAKTRYVKVEYKNTKLLLLRDAPAVLWHKLERDSGVSVMP